MPRPVTIPEIICVLLVLAETGNARADENPFGLPAPHDSNRPGTVMLHGGGRTFYDEIRQEFVRLAGGTEARILLMPSDSYQLGKDEDGVALPGGESGAAYERRMAREYRRWVALREQGRVADFQFLYRDPVNDPDDTRLLALLDKATGVWMPALDQERLPNEFAHDYPTKTSRFQLALREVVARGGIVGGSAAGWPASPRRSLPGTRRPTAAGCGRGCGSACRFSTGRSWTRISTSMRGAWSG